MRAGALAAGVFLMIIGAMIFFICYSEVAEYQTWLGQFARALSPQAEREYRLYSIGAMIGAILALSGLAVTIYGAVAQEKRT
ncbi:MAG: hypothetical protein QXR62_06220 [Candidatus Bathyarchaeia archaeon]